jgi:hypothetical protein
MGRGSRPVEEVELVQTLLRRSWLRLAVVAGFPPVRGYSWPICRLVRIVLCMTQLVVVRL